MSGRSASCPGCGAALEFRNAATVLVVCASCGSASARGDADLRLLGKVGAVADLDSPVWIGARGRDGDRGFLVCGRLQVDHGLGPWNEWCLAFDDGAWGWLAEALGEFHLLLPWELPAAEAPGEAPPPGKRIAGKGGTVLQVVERGRGRVVAVEGELPVEALPGETYRYADLRGPGAEYATLDFHDEGGGLRAAYLGRTVDREVLRLDPPPPRAEPRRVPAARVACPNCGGSIDVRCPETTLRVGCTYCGSLLSRDGDAVAVLDAEKRATNTGVLRIGAKGRIGAVACEVVGYLERSVRVDGTRYPWDEYLLATPSGPRWLVLAQGNWSWVEPANPAAVARTPGGVSYRGVAHRSFQAGEARVDRVIGEFPWLVKRGDVARTEDYVAQGTMVSLEKTDDEVTASLGTWLPRATVETAFPTAAAAALPKAPGPHQPNPWVRHRAASWRVAGLLACLALALLVFFHLRAPARLVATIDLPAGATAEKGATRIVTTHFSEEFEEQGRFNCEFRLDGRLNNGWIAGTASLVDLDTGDVRAATLSAEKWSGVTDGESWSEGDDDDRAWIGSLPPGRYAVRFEAERSLPRDQGTLTVRTRVASMGRPFLVLVLLLAFPLAISILAGAFESRRWAESDEAGGEEDDE